MVTLSFFDSPSELKVFSLKAGALPLNVIVFAADGMAGYPNEIV